MSSLKDSLYLSSPIWAQQAVVAGYGWWWFRRRFGSDFHHLVHEFKSRERWGAEEFHDYQKDRLKKIFSVAWRSAYYRTIFTQADIAMDTPPFEALKRVPLLEKEFLRTNARMLLTSDRVPKGTVIFKSSGTTGTPTEIFYTRDFHALELAAPEARNLNWAGVTYRDRRVMFGVRKVCSYEQKKPPFWRFSPAENMAYASVYHLSPSVLPYYLEFLRSFRPAMIMGYPSALYTIARYALEHDDFPAPAKAVFTTSEKVSVNAREAIERAWHCRIYDRYGAVEGCLFASQCEFGRYHVSPEVGIIEIIDHQGAPVRPGELGEVICTGLQNTLQPLIRYRIGDVARWAVDQFCSCGRAMPILESIDGRFEDICYTSDGRQVVRFDTVFKGVETIREAQVVQEKLDSFTILVVPGTGFHARDIRTIQQNMHSHVGTANTEIRVVSSIPRTASGKFRAVICKLPLEERIRLLALPGGSCAGNRC